MRTVTWILVGLVEAVAFTVVVGVLSLQVSGIPTGAIYGLDNALVSLMSPSVPILPYVAIALVSLMVVASVTVFVRRASRTARIGLSAGLGTGLVALTIWAIVLHAAQLDAWKAGVDDVTAYPPIGWDGWVRYGGSNSVVHLVALVSIAVLVLAIRRRDDATRTAAPSEEGGLSER